MLLHIVQCRGQCPPPQLRIIRSKRPTATRSLKALHLKIKTHVFQTQDREMLIQKAIIKELKAHKRSSGNSVKRTLDCMFPSLVITSVCFSSTFLLCPGSLNRAPSHVTLIQESTPTINSIYLQETTIYPLGLPVCNKYNNSRVL